jgi:hypothetical protein
MMVDLIDDYDAIAKTVAEVTCRQDDPLRQQLIEQLMREIMSCDAEFRREDAAGTIGSRKIAKRLESIRVQGSGSTALSWKQARPPKEGQGSYPPL